MPDYLIALVLAAGLAVVAGICYIAAYLDDHHSIKLSSDVDTSSRSVR